MRLMRKIVDKWVAEKTTEEVVDQLVEIGVPVGAVMDLDEAQISPQAVARGMFVKVQHPVMGRLSSPGSP